MTVIPDIFHVTGKFRKLPDIQISGLQVQNEIGEYLRRLRAGA